MKIRRDGCLQINVPFATPKREIEAFIAKKYTWLKQAIAQQAARHKNTVKEYKYGEIHPYLGQKYELQLITAARNMVLLGDKSIKLFHRSNSNIKHQLKQWYKQQATAYLTTRSHELQKQHHFPKIKAIKFRFMKARWGSCSNDAVITYNIHLIKAPTELIDYVIIHELCHLIHPNHGRGFYLLQSTINPNWRKHKSLLNHF